MKKVFSILIALVAVALVGFGADVGVKYSGPSGQGQLIYWCPTNGITNVVFTADGVSYLRSSSGATILLGGATLTVKGTLLEATNNLTVGSDLVVGNNGTVTGKVTAADVEATDDLTVGDDAAVGGDLTVTNITRTLGTTILGGTTVFITNNISITGTVTMAGEVCWSGVFTNMWDDGGVIKSNILWYKNGSITNRTTNP